MSTLVSSNFVSFCSLCKVLWPTKSLLNLLVPMKPHMFMNIALETSYVDEQCSRNFIYFLILVICCWTLFIAYLSLFICYLSQFIAYLLLFIKPHMLMNNALDTSYGYEQFCRNLISNLSPFIYCLSLFIAYLSLFICDLSHFIAYLTGFISFLSLIIS